MKLWKVWKPLMKRVGKPVVLVVVLLIAALTYIAAAGVHTTYGDDRISVVKGASEIRFGMDIRGGVDVTFRPPTNYKATRSEMDAATAVLRSRLDSKNITDAEVYTDYTNRTITVRFPWKSDQTDEDPDAAVQELGATAALTFRGPTTSTSSDTSSSATSSETSSSGTSSEAAAATSSSTSSTSSESSDSTSSDTNGPVILTGDDVKSAAAIYSQEDSEYQVQLTLKDSGKTKFAAATEKYKGESISIWMDDTEIETATVDEAITNGVAVISGSNMTSAEATKLANQINAGALPFKLVTDNYQTISAPLGQNALQVMLMAGVAASILIVLFMLIYYRLPGLIACVALTGHVAGTLLAISIPQFTLTLPGIAGIILSIGMGVDCNIITAERIREELRFGKSLDGAIDAGFERSFAAIFDGNVTVVIVGFILYFLGSATVKSFGYTLLVGVVFNFIMGILLSRLMLKSVSRFGFARAYGLYTSKSRTLPQVEGASK